MREIIKEARSVDEAIDHACIELGVDRGKIDFEIISLPKRSLFGLKNTPAKVRVFLPEEEAVPEAAPPIQERKPVQKQEAVPAPQKTVPDYAPKDVNEAVKPIETKTAAQAAAVPLPSASVKEKQKETENREDNMHQESQTLDFGPVGELEGKEKTAVEYLQNILRTMGVEAQLLMAHTESGIVIRLLGEGLGVIIGRRGETLDALQYLCGLAANREEGDYLRVTIDSGNYREKRERTLQQLAQKLSNASIRYGRSTTLEPMNPYERRIIHATVSKIDGVNSASIGEEPNRRVVITPTNLKPQGQRSGYGRSGSRPPRGGAKPGQRDARGSAASRRPPRAPRPQPNNGKPEYPFKSAADREQKPNVKPTPVAVDKQYAKELEKSEFVKPKPQSPVQKETEKTTPVREKTPAEVESLPLYGKIEL